MTVYDIYLGTGSEEPTSHGAEVLWEGMNPADALSKYMDNEDAMNEMLRMHEDVNEIAAFDDEMSAHAYKVENGAWELHVYVGDADVAITL